MSQKGQFTITGFTEVKSLTGDVGGPVGATLSNIDVVGGTNIQTSGNPGTSTLTVSLIGTNDHAVQIGNLAGGLTSAALGLSGQFFAGTTGADPGWIGPLINGQLFIGSTGALPVAANITAGANIGVANGAGTITLKVSGTTNHAVQVGNGTGDLTSLAVGGLNEILIGNAGADASWSATPTVTTMNATTFSTIVAAAHLTMAGTTITAVGTDVNIPINITTQGNSNVIIGPNSLTLTTPLTVANGGTGANTLLIHGLLVGNTVGALNAVAVGATGTILTGATAADPVWSAALTNGQLLIGNTGNAPTAAAITAGANIGVANAAGSITLKVAGTTQYAVQVGNGTGDLTSLAVGATGEVLVGATGANAAWSATPTVTTLTATTLRTGDPAVAASCLSIAGTTITGTGTGADVGLTVTPKGTGALTLTTGDVVVTSGAIKLPTTSATVGQIQINAVKWLHAYGTSNTFVGQGAGNVTLTTANASSNTGIGYLALSALAGTNANEGSRNVGIGSSALAGVTEGSFNAGVGHNAGSSITTGTYNCMLGYNAATGSFTTGSYNVVIGASTAGAYTGAESSNIIIGYNITGTNGISNRLRIGKSNTNAAGGLTTAFIFGIRGVTTAQADAVAVLIDSDSQLGTVSSSIKVKQDVDDMGAASSPVMKLRPVTFRYKQHKDRVIKSYGLIAEEVAEVFPDIVVLDEEGNPETIQYHILPSILLNEIQKQQKIILELTARIEALEKRS